MTTEQLDKLLTYIDARIEYMIEEKKHGDADHHMYQLAEQELRELFGLPIIG